MEDFLQQHLLKREMLSIGATRSYPNKAMYSGREGAQGWEHHNIGQKWLRTIPGHTMSFTGIFL